MQEPKIKFLHIIMYHHFHRLPYSKKESSFISFNSEQKSGQYLSKEYSHVLNVNCRNIEQEQDPMKKAITHRTTKKWKMDGQTTAKGRWSNQCFISSETAKHIRDTYKKMMLTSGNKSKNRHPGLLPNKMQAPRRDLHSPKYKQEDTITRIVTSDTGKRF